MTLMIGPAVAIHVNKDILDALISVEVDSRTDGPSGFQMTFHLGPNSPLETLFLWSGGVSIPFIRVVIAVTVNGTPEVIMDGVVTKIHVAPNSDPSQSTLTVTGEDLTRIMDYFDLSGIPYPAMPSEASVLLMLAKYAVFGVVPAIIPSIMIDVPIPVVDILSQQGTDLQYINMLACSVGYVFYLEPGPEPGMSIAYWGPEIKVGMPQPALNINMDAHTNVESLSFGYDPESASMPIVFLENDESRVIIPIPVKDLSPINPPLAIIPPIPKKFPLINVSGLSPIKAILLSMAKAAKSSEVVSAQGTLDVLRYGHVLKAHRLVGVRGAGTAFDGLYYVRSVTHKIKRGEYKQSFTLSRNGLISIPQKVPV